MWGNIDLNNQEFILIKEPDAAKFSLHLLQEDADGPWHLSDFNGNIYSFSETNHYTFEANELNENMNCDTPPFQNYDGETKYETYISKVEKAILDIKNNALHKVVLSRRVFVDVHLHIIKTIQNMARVYPNACVSAFSSKHAGFWICATPEQLLKCADGKAIAASLAGTKLNSDEEDFGPKELDEQQWVTDGIVDTFKTFGLTDIATTQPETKYAGPVKHLFSAVTGSIHSDALPLTLAKMLHPTPAIGGYPLKKAVAYIAENEGYNRRFYSGFFGFADADNCSLWVNLRCMQIFENRVVLYAGGGITASSQPEKEWEETQRKLQTLLRVIEPIK